MKFKKSFIIFMALVVLVPLSAFGATIKVGETYSSQSGEVVNDNLYIGAGEIFVDGDIEGDLMTGGGNIAVSGIVRGDATIAGGDISVLERVEGDLRIAGGDILVTADVAGDLAIVGGNVRILSGVTIGKDLIVMGGRVLSQGIVYGNVKAIGGAVEIDSRVGGDVNVKAGEAIKIGDNAVIGGNLIYGGESKSVLTISDKAVISGEITFKESKVMTSSSASIKSFVVMFLKSLALVQLMAILLAVLLATVFLKKFSNRVARSAIENIGKKTIWGFVTMIIVPAGIIFFFVTVLGIAIGILGILGYIILITLASIYSGIIFGAWMDKLIMKKQEVVSNWKNGLLGAAILMLIVQIPVIGGLAGFFFFLLALGSISTIAYGSLWANRK